ncbi:histidine phosphatase family protein [Suicoccus acidiformans]|uniref:histidine phosphatase family protein n=1 Tax=Suicoccus acidiformans TaxID=2036206 RepID=UPI0013C2F69A|nr:histidine phosphatase family protein [Suicoccus acidiformans]
MKVYLCRHGQTDMNAQRKFYGRLDVSLNDLGREQARQIGKQMANDSLTIRKVVTSGLRRTKETAEEILDSYGQLCLHMESYNALNEIDFGTWEGLSADDIERRDYNHWWAYIEAPLNTQFPEGEEHKTFRLRVEECLSKIEFVEGTLLVGHLGVLRIFMQYYNLSDENYFSIDIPQGEYICVELFK